MNLVAEYHSAIGYPVNYSPISVDSDVVEAKHKELLDNINALDAPVNIAYVVGVAGKIVNVMYSIYSACLTFGIPVDMSLNTWIQFPSCLYMPNLESREINMLKAHAEKARAMMITNEHLTYTNDVARVYHDMYYTVLNLFSYFCITPVHPFEEEHKKRMSVFCLSEYEAIKTMQYYISNTDHQNISYKQSADKIHWLVYEETPSGCNILGRKID